MRMVPAVVHEFHSQAERRLFDLLRSAELGQAGTVLHSLNLSRHEYKRWGEIDFVVVCALGVFCLEVKGGRVACREGIWVFTDRWGHEHRSSEGPFEQAKSGTYALRTLLERTVPPGDLKNVTFGWAVSFPDCPFPTRSVEFDAALVIDAERLLPANGLVDSIRRMTSFWRAKEPSPRNLEPALIKCLVDACRPSFDVVPLLGQQIQGVARLVASLTSEQYQFLDALEDAPRILCQGGAGTGKTFLALEAAKRERTAGRSVMVVCRSPVLAEFLRTRLGSATPVKTARDLQAHTTDNSKVQTLVLDEAQDFMTLDVLQRLDLVVEGGLERGRWRVFLDPNNQAGIYGEYEADALEWLRNCGAVPLKLRRNCRNTEPIVRQTQLATGADIGTTIIEGGGPAVELVTVADRASEATALAARIQKWQDEGVERGGITVLSPVEFRSSAASLLPDALRRHMTLLGPSAMARWPGSSLSFATIEQFKGLENQCIAVIGLDGYDASDRATSELYVAMTRAHAGLWIAIPADPRKLLDSCRSRNMVRLAASGGL
jgi:hypothetical protein